MLASEPRSFEVAKPQVHHAQDSRSTMTPSLPGAHRYHDWVLSSIAPFLRHGRTLEIGSGHGAYARRLLSLPQVESLYVSDIDPQAISRIQGELEDVADERVHYLVMDGLHKDQLPEPVDNIVLINVLEHIFEDRALLRSAKEVLRPGGVVAIFAPAFALLYSRMDFEAGHHRRYELLDLCQRVRDAGLHVTHARYFNAIGFFGWYVNKLLGSGVHSKSADTQLRLYERLVPFFRHADSLLPFLGQSVVVIGVLSGQSFPGGKGH